MVLREIRIETGIQIGEIMILAGVAEHPGEWIHGGYREIQNSKPRYTLIDRQKLTALLGIKDSEQLTEYHRNWVF